MTLRTRFLGLLKLRPGIDPPRTNDGEFFNKNMDALDSVAAHFQLHRHNGEPVPSSLAPDPPTLLLDDDSDGGIAGNATVVYRVAIVDATGTEGVASIAQQIDTPGPVATPEAPTAERIASGGSFAPGHVQYAITAWKSFLTYQTIASPSVTANLPGSAGDAQQVVLTLPALPEGADGFNIYRRRPNSTTFNLLATVPAEDAGEPFIDDGSTEASNEILLPTTDTSAAGNSITVTPNGTLEADEAWRIYRSYQEDDEPISWLDTLLAELPEDGPGFYLDLGGPTGNGSPLDDAVTFENPGPIDLWTETTGVLPAERTAVALHFNQDAPTRTATLHNDWGELMAALAFMPEAGRQVIMEKDFTIPTAGMPTDGWHMHKAAFSCPIENATSPVIITFPTGVKLDPAGVGFGPIVDGNVGLYSTSTSPIVEFEGGRGVFLVLSRGALLAKASPFFKVDIAGPCIVAQRDGNNILRPSQAGIMDGDYEAIEIAATGFGLFVTNSSSAIADNVVRGAADNVGWQFDAHTGNPRTGDNQANLNGGDGWAEMNMQMSADSIRLDSPPSGMPGVVGDALRWLAENGGAGGVAVGGGGAAAQIRTRTVTASVTNGSTDLELTDGFFTTGDDDSIVTGPGIDPGTTIVDFVSRTVATMSAPATADGTDIDVDIENVTPSILMTEADPYPAGGYGLSLGVGSDLVEVILPPAIESTPMFITVSAGDGEHGVADMNRVAFESPSSQFTFPLSASLEGRELLFDPAALAGLVLAVPLPAGPGENAWVICAINPPPPEGGGGSGAQLQSERGGGTFYALERVGRTFNGAAFATYTNTSATAWLIASDSDQQITGLQTFINTAGAAGSKMRVALYELVNGNAGELLLDHEFTVDSTGWKTPTWTGVPVTPAGLVAVIAVEDEATEFCTFAERPGIDLGSHENNSVRRLVTPGTSFPYGAFPADGADLDLTPVLAGDRPYMLWKLG